MCTSTGNAERGGEKLLKYSTLGAQIPDARLPLRIHFCSVAPNISVSRAWTMFKLTFPAPRIFRWFVVLYKNLSTPAFIAGDMREE